jgi:thiol-disulfide isomerase/thioredoxin
MSLRPRLLLILALCVAAGFFAGRVYWTMQDPPAIAASPVAAAAPERMPEFRLRDLDGTNRAIGEWSSQGLVLNFWATWCAPCRKEMPLLEQLHRDRAGKGLAVVGIAVDREEPVRTFVGETGVTYPILLGEQDAMAAAESFGPSFVGLPLTVLAAPGGEILKLHVGELHPEDLAAFVSVLDRLAEGTLSVAAARKALEKG